MCRAAPLVSLLALGAGFLLAVARPAVGEVHTYTGFDDHAAAPINSAAAESDFFAHLASYGTEPLDGFQHGTPTPALTYGGTGLSSSSSGTVFTFPPLAISQPNVLLDSGPFDPADTASIVDDQFVFNRPITAFGGYFANGGDIAGDDPNVLNIKLDSSTDPGRLPTFIALTLGPGWGFDNVFYAGITDTTPFDRVTLIESIDFDGILMDSITAGYVPEPAGMALLGAGAAGLALARGWKKRRA